MRTDITTLIKPRITQSMKLVTLNVSLVPGCVLFGKQHVESYVAPQRPGERKRIVGKIRLIG